MGEVQKVPVGKVQVVAPHIICPVNGVALMGKDHTVKKAKFSLHRSPISEDYGQGTGGYQK